MPKRDKKEKQGPNVVVFLVEGESDQIALELPLAELITEKYPDFEVRFLLQQKLVNKEGDEVEDSDDRNDDGIIAEDEYKFGGDITSSFYVTPSNIESKIHHRFIKPATKTEGLYPKLIARIIHIVDTDGVYLPPERVVLFTNEHKELDAPYYDSEKAKIKAKDVSAIIDRNDRKKRNLDYLLSLSEQGIKIGTKTIPYEIYFFSSNLDHFINHEANMKDEKKKKADIFLRTYGLDLDDFCKYFFEDPDSIGHLGYQESWDKIREGTNSICRHTNIDCLIRKLQERE